MSRPVRPELVEGRTDSILIEGLRVQAHVGVPLAERRRLQPVRIDLKLGLDLRTAGRMDRVEKTLDYAAVAQEVKGLVRGRSFRLAEAMAEAIAERLLRKFKPARIRVQIRKFSVPGATSVGVAITRGRWRRR